MIQAAVVIVSVPSSLTPGKFAVALKVGGVEGAALERRSYRMGARVNVEPCGERWLIVGDAP